MSKFEKLLEEFWFEFPEFLLLRPLFNIKFSKVKTGSIRKRGNKIEIILPESSLKFVENLPEARFLTPEGRRDVLKWEGTLEEPNPFPILLHEILHLVRGDLSKIPDGYDEKVWRVAVDYYIKRIQEELSYVNTYHIDFLRFTEAIQPKILSIPLENMTVEELYYLLLEKKDDIILDCDTEVPEVIDDELEEERSMMRIIGGIGKTALHRWLRFNVRPRKLDIPLKIAKSVYTYALTVKHNFDFPDYTSYFPKRIVYPYREFIALNAGVIVDVSGSMTRKEIAKVLGYLKDFRINIRWILAHNVKVLKIWHSREEFEKSEEIPQGGGTDYTEAYEKTKSFPHVELILHFTDGWAEKPNYIPHNIFYILTKKPMDWVLSYPHYNVRS